MGLLPSQEMKERCKRVPIVGPTIWELMCVICVSWGQRREIEEDNIDIDMTNHASIQVSEQGSETLNKELGKIRFELNEKREKSKRKLLEKDDWQASRSATKQLSVTCNTWKHRWSLVTGSSQEKIAEILECVQTKY